MLFEPTTLAAASTALIEAVESYGCDPKKLYAHAGLDIDEILKPGARFPFRAVTKVWKQARVETGDPCIGLYAARRLKPQALHALGLSWLASPTLYDGLKRMQRYSRITNTALQITIEEDGDNLFLQGEVHAGELQPAPEAVDGFAAAIVRMCRLMTNEHFAPAVVEFRHEDNGHIEQYIEYFKSPVKFSCPANRIGFDLKELQLAVPSGNEELARQTDRLAERYLATLDHGRVQDKVREILLTLLPSGNASQTAVAEHMHRSVSALQRQLKAEGATYRQVLDETRQDLAKELLSEQRYSLSQVAYLLGFSDQANFTRAFKRWTGDTPAEYRRN